MLLLLLCFFFYLQSVYNTGWNENMPSGTQIEEKNQNYVLRAFESERETSNKTRIFLMAMKRNTCFTQIKYARGLESLRRTCDSIEMKKTIKYYYGHRGIISSRLQMNFE